MLAFRGHGGHVPRTSNGVGGRTSFVATSATTDYRTVWTGAIL